MYFWSNISVSNIFIFYIIFFIFYLNARKIWFYYIFVYLIVSILHASNYYICKLIKHPNKFFFNNSCSKI